MNKMSYFLYVIFRCTGFYENYPTMFSSLQSMRLVSAVLWLAPCEGGSVVIGVQLCDSHQCCVCVSSRESGQRALLAQLHSQTNGKLQNPATKP